MQLSNTTNQNGLVQRVEYHARLPYGSSGDLLRTIINNINSSFEDIMPLLLSYSDHIRWDDTNHTDAPIGYVNIVSGQNDYKISTDGNALDILNITNVRILSSATDDKYEPLERLTIEDDWRVQTAMSPNSDDVGVPTHFLENAGKIFLYPNPNYAATNGIEIFFQRQQSYFTVTGTSGNDTTEPGIPLPFHELLAIIAAHSYVSVNRPDDGNTITRLEEKIERKKQDLSAFIDLRNPSRAVMSTRPISFR